MNDLWTVSIDLRTANSLHVSALVVSAKDDVDALAAFFKIFQNNSAVTPATVQKGIDRTNKALTGLYNPELLNRIEEAHNSLTLIAPTDPEATKIHLFGKFTFIF